MYHSSPCLTGSHSKCVDTACKCVCHDAAKGEADKVGHQFDRAVKLADCIMFKMNASLADFQKMLARNPQVDYWKDLSFLCMFEKPASITTQRLAVKILEDRQHYATVIQALGRGEREPVRSTGRSRSQGRQGKAQTKGTAASPRRKN